MISLYKSEFLLSKNGLTFILLIFFFDLFKL